MSSSITVKVANLTATVVSAKNDSDTANIIRWFVQDKMSPIPDGLTQAQQNQLILDAAATELARYIRQEAQRVRLRDLLAAQQSAADQASQDTQI